MSKESALATATQVQLEAKVSPVTGAVPSDAKTAANPAVENGGVVPPTLASTQLSHLAKKEAKLQAEREAFKKEREEFEELKQKVKGVYDKANAFEETRKKDPIKAFKELGFTEKEIIDYLAQEEAPKPSTEEIVQAELKKFQDEQTKKAKEIQAKRDQETIQKFKGQLSEVIKADPQKYELCAYHGPIAEQLMFDIAVEEAKAGEAPDPKSIADDVEEFYLNQFEAMRKLNKLTPKQEAVLEKAQPERSRTVHPPQDAVKPKATTLTNKIAATTAAIAKPKAESSQEKRARIEAMIRNGLIK